MKLTFDPPSDGAVHQYCWNCHRDGVTKVTVGTTRLHHCAACGQTLPRALIIDPKVKWWLDDSREYWHETAGVFVGNPAGQFLFFERTAHPLGLTPPAGHVDFGETPEIAGRRELFEEVGLRAGRLTHLATDDIVGDECRRGSDAHRWQSFGLIVPADTPIHLSEEGLRPIWLTLEEAESRDLTFATRFVITRHREALQRLTQ